MNIFPHSIFSFFHMNFHPCLATFFASCYIFPAADDVDVYVRGIRNVQKWRRQLNIKMRKSKASSTKSRKMESKKATRTTNVTHCYCYQNMIWLCTLDCVRFNVTIVFLLRRHCCRFIRLWFYLVGKHEPKLPGSLFSPGARAHTYHIHDTKRACITVT